MKVILFGATGMVGQGVLLECLKDPEVKTILTIGRNPVGQTHPKLQEIIHKDFTDFSGIQKNLEGFDACFFCLGVSSVGMTEASYRHITYDFTLAAAQILVKLNPQMTFTYVSGAGTDSTEKGKIMWARVKGATENALLSLPFKAAYMFRPGAIEPLDGILPRNTSLRFLISIMKPVFPLLKWLFPRHVTSTRQIGTAMIQVVRKGAPKKILEAPDINDL
jgi:uncharacterized protein YbjT (DUF2867 family)